MPVGGGIPVLGDGNGDSIKDSQQTNVASMPFLLTPPPVPNGIGAPTTNITLVADSLGGKTDPDAGSAQLTSIIQKDAPANLPEGMNMPLGLIGFTAAVNTQGSAETFSLYVDANLGINGYWKQDASGTWVNLASEAFGGRMVEEGGRLRLDFTITDGGAFDSDGLADGIITDPGAAAYMPLSIIGYTPHIPDNGFWF